MILKAGRYRWNETLINSYAEIGSISQDIEAIVNVSVSQIGYTGVGTISHISISPPLVKNAEGEYYLDVNSLIVNVTVTNIKPESSYIELPTIPTIYYDGWREDMMGDKIREFILPYDQEVSNIAGSYIISNSNYNEINPTPLATIEYNGQVIASLNAGETATLSCEGKKMASDVVVKVNEVESKIPEGYIKPEGTLELVFNNIEAEFPIDCSQYAKVTVNTAEPLKITDPTVLDNITDSPWGVGGNVFLYEGETTDTYESGTLYYLEDTDK